MLAEKHQDQKMKKIYTLSMIEVSAAQCGLILQGRF